jgi:formiminoglutamase
LLTFDAHFDLRETDAGLTNGNPIRALLEDGLPGPHITQIGLQSFANSPAHARVAREVGIQVVTREEVAAAGIQAVVVRELTRLASQTEVIYVDFDIDVLDRAFAPATPGARPGGLAPTELFQAAALCGAHPSVVAADIVEISPPADTNEVTVFSAAKVLLSLAAGLGTRRS